MFDLFLQVIALLWFLMSYIPGGHSGMLFFTKLFTSSVSKTLPVWLQQTTSLLVPNLPKLL